MTKERASLYAAAAALIVWPTAASADVVWPALYAEQRLFSIPAILVGLLVETATLKYAFAMPWRRAATASLAVNAASALLGSVLIPLAGVVWEVFPGLILSGAFDLGTFNPITWTATFLLALAVTTSIEVVCLKRFFHLPAEWRTWRWWLFANSVTVMTAFASFAIRPSDTAYTVWLFR